MSESNIGSRTPWSPSKPGEDQKPRVPSSSISTAGKYARELENKRERTEKSQSHWQAPPSHGSFNQASSTDQEPHASTKSVSSAGQYAEEFASKKLTRAPETQSKTSSSQGLVKRMISQQRSECSVREAELSFDAEPLNSTPRIPTTHPKPAPNTRSTNSQFQTPSDTGFKVFAVPSSECTKWSHLVDDLAASIDPLDPRIPDKPKFGPLKTIKVSSSVPSPSAPQTTVKAGKTTKSLAEWISPDNAMPRSFDDNGACRLARARIVQVACTLAKEVRDIHYSNTSMRGSLSPQNITLVETTHQDKPTKYEVDIMNYDLDSTDTDEAFKAPWLRRIPKEAWSQTVTGHAPLRRKTDESGFQLGIKEADIWSLGAIFWAMCEGGVSFMNEPYNIENFIQEAGKRVKSCEKWKFFALILACLQETDGDEQGVPNPRLRIHSLQKICDFLETKADEVYEDAGDVYAHWTQVKGYIRV